MHNEIYFLTPRQLVAGLWRCRSRLNSKTVQMDFGVDSVLIEQICSYNSGFPYQYHSIDAPFPYIYFIHIPQGGQ